MERIVALKKLQKLLGKDLGYRVNDKAPNAEKRAEAQRALDALLPLRDAARDARDKRYRLILDSDVEYQRLSEEARRLRKEADELSGLTRWFKITVGVSRGMFFEIKAEGDSWEEILEKLGGKK